METIRITVVTSDSVEELQVSPGANLLMAMVQAKLPAAFMCTTGKCTACRVRMDIPSGSAAPASETERYRLGSEQIALGYRLACQVYVQGPLTVYL